MCSLSRTWKKYVTRSFLQTTRKKKHKINKHYTHKIYSIPWWAGMDQGKMNTFFRFLYFYTFKKSTFHCFANNLQLPYVCVFCTIFYFSLINLTQTYFLYRKQF